MSPFNLLGPGKRAVARRPDNTPASRPNNLPVRRPDNTPARHGQQTGSTKPQQILESELGIPPGQLRAVVYFYPQKDEIYIIAEKEIRHTIQTAIENALRKKGATSFPQFLGQHWNPRGYYGVARDAKKKSACLFGLSEGIVLCIGNDTPYSDPPNFIKRALGLH